MQISNQLVGVEVLVSVEDVTHEHAPGAGQLFAPNLEELAKFLLGRRGDGEWCKFFCAGLGHEDILRGSRPAELNCAQGRAMIKNHSPL